ncbi:MULTISPECIES: CDP-diacylglycerol--serine O-phosphatidyltransferase [Spirosoma]|uniref:CDP-diacylglycerol--serine O-phosphatidyltransferase n=1 Tax=Spirosoma liriopis TaxID=2937440 RepID=A0ABT0HFU1_9BACT|nr:MULTISPECIES: CDP-diacylglycerol--serine O-phosphatidyltransferase [Spirosoma]MCK8491026.1 CDP-diacylglycerol--serine O-phosphatidyltransferase [Spirosoma liriopis]UHG90410.1 CDP-diacylglycerol--serine O-phosphatidyltransferase [Spirosoma oryzicola]
MNVLKHLPNAMTCGNLLCGCIGLVMALRGHLETASWLIGLAAILDFGDGFVARMVNVSGPFGKELDSLADVVTFGVLPATIVFQLCWFQELGAISYGAFLIAVLSALRLANFNIDTRQSESFIGLPVPANAMLIASFPLMSRYQPQYDSIWQNDVALGMMIAFSFMLVSEVPLFALKFKTFSWAENRIKFSFLIASALLLLLLQFAAIPLIILLYIVISLFTK